MDELARAEAWLYATLSADTALAALVGTRIFAESAPDKTVFPFVTFNWMAGHDVNIIEQFRILTHALYLVKGIDEGRSITTLKSIADRIDAVLHGKEQIVIGDATLLMCNREQPFSMAETTDGKEYRHRGGQYRLLMQPTTT
jgi:hypothetical protein